MVRDGLFLLFNLACIWIVIKGLSKYQVPFRNLLIITMVWLALLLVLSTSGFLSNFSTFPPRMMMVLALPLVLLLWFIFSRHSDQVLTKVPAPWIVNLQGFRVVVELFIWWAYLDHALPIQMTFEGRNFDILVGLTAPLVARLWLKPGNEKPAMVLTWNVLGIIILLNIVVIAVLSMPTPKQYFFNEPANTLVAGFPWVLLPGILVMLAIALHLISIRQVYGMMKRRPSQ